MIRGLKSLNKGLSNWDVWTQDPTHVSDQSTGQIAADSYHNYKDDVKLISDMGMNVYRLSIAWARIIPNGLGDVNQEVGCSQSSYVLRRSQNFAKYSPYF